MLLVYIAYGILGQFCKFYMMSATEQLLFHVSMHKNLFQNAGNGIKKTLFFKISHAPLEPPVRFWGQLHERSLA